MTLVAEGLNWILHHTRLITTHKSDARIRPVISRKNAPNYNVAKCLTRTLESYVSLPDCCTYHYLTAVLLKNILNIITDLIEIENNEISRLSSLHIQNTHTNKLKNIGKFSFTNNLINYCIKHEPVEICHVIISQERMTTLKFTYVKV